MYKGHPYFSLRNLGTKAHVIHGPTRELGHRHHEGMSGEKQGLKQGLCKHLSVPAPLASAELGGEECPAGLGRKWEVSRARLRWGGVADMADMGTNGCIFLDQTGSRGVGRGAPGRAVKALSKLLPESVTESEQEKAGADTTKGGIQVLRSEVLDSYFHRGKAVFLNIFWLDSLL